MKKGLLIVGHGSRTKDAQDIFKEVVELVKHKSKYHIVEGAYMEICKPSIKEMITKFSEENVEEIIIVPYFLYEGIHVKVGIPKIIDKLSKEYENINFRIGKPIGAEPLLADILISRAEEISS